MTKQLFPGKTGSPPTLIGALTRMGDGEGLHPARGATMSLSTTEDGQDMSTPNFGGKRAAPFTKGGGRSKKHPNDAKGKKRAIAKAVLKKGGDYSVEGESIDLAYRPSEPRGTDGRWIRAALGAKTQAERNAVRRGAQGDYQAAYTSHREHSAVLDILDKADVAAKGHATMDHRLGQTMDAIAVARAKRRQAKAVARDAKRHDAQVASDAKRHDAQVAAEGRSHDAQVAKEAKAHDMQVAAEAAAKYAKGGPTWLPEKGARGPAEAKYLAAKNMLAQATLAQNDRLIKKARKKVAKAQAAFENEKAGRPSGWAAFKASAAAVSDAMGG